MVRMSFVYTACTALGLALLISPAQAQERSANGSTDLQMTWSSLTNLVNAANTKSVAVDARVNQIVTCNAKSMLYVPGSKAPKADKDGCIPNGEIERLKTRVTDVETNIKTIKDDIVEINSTLTTYGQSIKTLTTDVTTLKSKLGTLTTRVDANDKDILALQGRMKLAEDDIEDINVSLGGVKRDIKTLGTRLDAEITRVSVLIARVDATFREIDNTITALERDVTAVTSSLNLVLACGDKGMVYDKSAKGCVTPQGEITYRWVQNGSKNIQGYSGGQRDTPPRDMAADEQACSFRNGARCSEPGKKCWEYSSETRKNASGQNGHDSWTFHWIRAVCD